MAPEMRGCGHTWTDALQPLICPQCLNPRTHIVRIK
jgi:rubrerythrin